MPISNSLSSLNAFCALHFGLRHERGSFLDETVYFNALLICFLSLFDCNLFWAWIKKLKERGPHTRWNYFFLAAFPNSCLLGSSSDSLWESELPCVFGYERGLYNNGRLIKMKNYKHIKFTIFRLKQRKLLIWNHKWWKVKRVSM